jgi:hypothetical protein
MKAERNDSMFSHWTWFDGFQVFVLLLLLEAINLLGKINANLDRLKTVLFNEIDRRRDLDSPL